MDYRLGNSKKINMRGVTEELPCPKCKKNVCMTAFSNFYTRADSKMPFVNLQNIYFLICPNCNSVFGIDSSLGKCIKENKKNYVASSDLFELDEFKA